MIPSFSASMYRSTITLLCVIIPQISAYEHWQESNQNRSLESSYSCDASCSPTYDNEQENILIYKKFTSWSELREWMRKFAERLGIVSPSNKAYSFRNDNDEESYECPLCTINDQDFYEDNAVTLHPATLSAPYEDEQLVMQRAGNYVLIYLLSESPYDGSWQYANTVRLYNVVTGEWMLITLAEAYNISNQMPPRPA